MEDPNLEALIYDGIRFVESLTRYYGAEKGQEVWNALGEAVGREVKGKIFFALLTGQTGGRVRFSAGNCQQAVPVIKTIRTFTGWGLKEAKDAWDRSKLEPQTLDVSPDQQRAFSKSLRDLGCNVH